MTLPPQEVRNRLLFLEQSINNVVCKMSTLTEGMRSDHTVKARFVLMADATTRETLELSYMLRGLLRDLRRD